MKRKNVNHKEKWHINYVFLFWGFFVNTLDCGKVLYGGFLYATCAANAT